MPSGGRRPGQGRPKGSKTEAPPSTASCSAPIAARRKASATLRAIAASDCPPSGDWYSASSSHGMQARVHVRRGVLGNGHGFSIADRLMAHAFHHDLKRGEAGERHLFRYCPGALRLGALRTPATWS